MSLEKVKQALSLDVNGAPGMEQVLYMSQGDHGLREVEIELRQSGNHYHFTEKDCNAVLFCDKPDGKTVFNPVAIQEQKILVSFTDQMLAAAGPMACRIALFGKTGERLTSADFVVMIRENRADAVILSSNEFNALTDALSRIDEALKNADEALKKAMEAETSVEGYEQRIQTALAENQEAVRAAKEVSEETVKVKDATQTVKEETQDAREKAETAAKNASEATMEIRETQKHVTEAADRANEAAERANQASEEVTGKQASVDKSIEKAEQVIEHYQNVDRAIDTAVEVSAEKAKAAEESQKAAANSATNADRKATEADASADMAREAAETAVTEAAKVKTWKPVIQNGILTFVANNDPTPPEGYNVTGPEGPSPSITIGVNGNWFVNGVDTEKPSRGPKGTASVLTIGDNGNFLIDGKDTGQTAQGPQGPVGKDGSKWFFGTGLPGDTKGEEGDFFLNTASYDVYSKGDGVWSKIGNIRGERDDLYLSLNNGGVVHGNVTILGALQLVVGESSMEVAEKYTKLQYGSNTIVLYDDGVNIEGDVYLDSGSRKHMSDNPGDDEIATVGWIRENYPAALASGTSESGEEGMEP